MLYLGVVVCPGRCMKAAEKDAGNGQVPRTSLLTTDAVDDVGVSSMDQVRLGRRRPFQGRGQEEDRGGIGLWPYATQGDCLFRQAR